MAFNQQIKIGNKFIGSDHPVFFIAEAGVNHNGDINLAKQLVDVAVEAGADAVKFQTFKTDKLILQDTEMAEYQKRNTGKNESQYSMLQKLELLREHHEIIMDYCAQKDILFLSTPYDEESVELLDDLGIAAYKVASTDASNLPFLEYLTSKGKPIIYSTGMSFMSEIERAVFTFQKKDFKDLVILQCVSNYPVDFKNANLLVIKTLQERFDALVGYSDHTTGIGVVPYSIPLGAKVVEKHFTLNKNLPGPDQTASLDPSELKECIQLIRDVEQAMGTGIKYPSYEEIQVKSLLQKSLVSLIDITQGEVITREALTAKRPGNGISPLYINEIIGKKAKVAIRKNTLLSYNMLEG